MRFTVLVIGSYNDYTLDLWHLLRGPSLSLKCKTRKTRQIISEVLRNKVRALRNSLQLCSENVELTARL